MKILVTGRGGAASWTIRGEQIGAALGATVKPLATFADMRAHDVILVVKRVPDQMLHDLHRCGRPWVYDIVDAYPQQPGLLAGRPAAMLWLREHLKRLRPDAVVWPNWQMWSDASEITDPGPETSVVYHHARPGIAVNPIREQVRILGYEGHPRYVESLRPYLTRECAARGIEFVLNPPSLAGVDVVLAWRDVAWASYPSQNWKSNVKLANAHASGTPFIGNPERGYQETATGREYWVNGRDEIGQSLDWLEHCGTRRVIHESFRAAALTLEAAAAQVRGVLIDAL